MENERDVTFRLKFENEDMIRVSEQIIEKNEEITIGVKDLEKAIEKAFKEGTKAVEDQSKALERQVRQLDVNKVKTKSLTEQIEAQKDVTRELEAELLRLQRSYVSVGDKGGAAAESLRNRMQQVRLELRESRQESKRLREEFNKANARAKEAQKSANSVFDAIESKGGAAGRIVANLGRRFGVVGAVVTGVITLIGAAFLDVEENSKKAKRELEGLKAVGNELKTRTFAGLRAVVQGALGDFGSAAKNAAEALGQGRDSLADIQQQGRDFFDLQSRIGEANRLLARTEAERVTQLEKINLLAGDESKTTEEKIGLIRQAASVQNEITGIRISELNNELALIRTENEVYGEQEGSLSAIAAIESELVELKGQSQLTAIQTQQQVNALLREEEEIRGRIIEQIKDANALFTNQQAERSLEKQIQAFQELRDSISAAGLVDQYAEEVTNLDEVIAGLSDRLQQGLVDPIKNELPTLLTESLQVSSQTAEILSEELEEGYRKALEQLQKKGFKDITDDQRRFIEEQFKDAFSSVADIVVQSTLTQIDRQEAVVDAREDNISELERQLVEQERLEENGRASQASALRSDLQREREILKREQDRRIELEKKAARQRLIANSLQQGSEITLASAKLLNQGASGFIPGLIAAAGGIALLFRIIAQARANAAAFATPPKFRTGTDYLVGPSHEGGGITIEAEGGERIFSKSLNEALGGSKYTNDQIRDFALLGMNAESAIAPMAAAIASGSSARKKEEEFQAWERNEVLSEVFREEIQGLKKEMRKVIKERPTYYPTEQAGRREYYKDGTKVIEKIVPR